MSHSVRARERRLKRKHLTKHEREVLASQHFGNTHRKPKLLEALSQRREK